MVLILIILLFISNLYIFLKYIAHKRLLNFVFKNFAVKNENIITKGIVSKFISKKTYNAYKKHIKKELDIEFEINRKEKLYKISYIINKMDYSELLFNEIVKNLLELFAASKGSIMLLNNRMELEIVGSIGLNEEINKNEKIEIGKNIVGKVIETGKGIYAKDIEKDLNIQNKKNYETTSFVSAPLKYKDETIGVINITERYSNKFFEEKDLNLLNIIGIQLGMLIYNKKLQDEKYRKSRMETIGAMASGIIHDIKNPITGIKGMLQLLYARVKKIDDKDEKIDKYYIIILEEIGRLSKMTNEILEYSKGVTITKEKIKVEKFIEYISEMYQEKLSISNSLPEKQEISIDEQKMKEVIINLVNNAIEAGEEKEDFKVEMFIFKEAGHFIFKIKDNGSGIPIGIQEKIFEPFYSTKKRGTGLGLSITKQIVEAHNGEIKLNSLEGVGTEFYIILPD